MNPDTQRKPHWLKTQLPAGENYTRLKHITTDNHLHTICTSGMCPNIAECWNHGTATFMILGDTCTRSCRFCATKTAATPPKPNPQEPLHVAQAVKLMGLKHCVITSVDRDDLPDRGAQAWVDTVNQIRQLCPNTTIETLLPDFDADRNIISQFAQCQPHIAGHNLETVERLTPTVRSKASYRRSLSTLQQLAAHGLTTKSGIMLGLGEERQEVINTLHDLLQVGCQLVTIGQYLRPRPQNIAVSRYVPPQEFQELKNIALQMGFKSAESGPLVRSSYHADQMAQAGII